jgi:drug/metabolite transporter (DMT)-like permease
LVDSAMHDVLILAVKGLAGGSLVVAFALLTEGMTPKRFAGLFSAAPAVAIAGLAITLLDKGPHDAHENAVGMIAGAAGMVAYAAVSVALLRRIHASRAAVVALTAWASVAALAAIPVLVA